jgi:propanol-preferring alcohol dehydrogenase
MGEMRVQQLDTPGPLNHRPLHLVQRPETEPAPGEIVVDVSACAVCRTDLQLVAGDLEARKLPIVPGHQAVGRVVAVGAGVDDWRVGSRAGIAWLAGSCGVCRHCASGAENLCEQAVFTGWDRDGGYADRVTARADFALHIPRGFTDIEAAPLLCGGVIGYRALKLSGIKPGGRLGLYGFGASALLTIQVAQHWDCDVFVATRSRSEQQRALEMGAAWAGGYHEPPPMALDAAITFAPVGYVVVEALRAVDRGGTVVVNAIHLDTIPEFPYRLLWSERQLRSVANFTRADAREFLELAAEIPIRTVVDQHRLEDANLALAALSAGEVDGAAVLVT